MKIMEETLNRLYRVFAHYVKPKDFPTCECCVSQKDKQHLLSKNLRELTAEELKNISKTSCTVLKEMGTSIQWMQSYVVGNKIYCVYRAENEELIKQHAKKGGFPCNSITEIVNVISPATATGG